MNRADVVACLQQLAASLGPIAQATEWHLFGSVDRGESDPEDIDLMILCASDVQADLLRQAIDPDSLALPLHLSLMTFQEAAGIDAVLVQRSTPIIRVVPPVSPEPTPPADASPLAQADPLRQVT